MIRERHGLFSLLNIAAYIAWSAVAFELVFGDPSTPAWLDAPSPTGVLAGLMALFLALLIVVTVRSPPENAARAMVVGQFALMVAMMLLSRSGALAILMVLVAIQVVHVWTPRWAVALLLAANAGLYFLYREVWHASAPLLSTISIASFQAFAAVTASFALDAERSRDALALTNADLLATRALLAESARDGERLRLSRELHDVAGHKLTALKLNLAALARDPRLAGDAQAALCARLADELLADIRGVVAQMRHSDGLGLGDALAVLAAPFPRPRMHLQIDAGARVGTLAQAEALLRAVQEGITNAARHSQAQNLWVVLRRDAASLRLDIRDDGRGGGDLRPGNGLRGMGERLAAVGGGLDVRRTDTGGVHLQAWLPTAA